jgi:hypothetical protein
MSLSRSASGSRWEASNVASVSRLGGGTRDLLFPVEGAPARGWRLWGADEGDESHHCICLTNGTHVIAIAVHLEGVNVPTITPAMKTSKVKTWRDIEQSTTRDDDVS